MSLGLEDIKFPSSKIFLSRRNLMSLLSKLDRKARGEESACTLIKNDSSNARYKQTMKSIQVTAVEDAEYYYDRPPGEVHPSDEPKKYVLVKFSDNWADEFDVNGFFVSPLKDWEKTIQTMKSEFEKNGSKEYSFGTNESLEYESYDDYAQCITVVELTETEYLTLKKFFPYSFGVFPGE